MTYAKDKTAAFEELQRLGMAYSYPPVRLHTTNTDDTNRIAEFDVIGLAFAPIVSMMAYPVFEESISQDLRSNDVARVRLGYASVVFWGHYGDGNRAKFAARRAGRTAGFDGNTLQHEMTEIARLVDAGAYGQGLVRAFGLPEIGSTSFASKLITFLAPHASGVLDLQIYEGLARTALSDRRSPFEDWLAEEFAPWAWTGWGTRSSKGRTAAGFDRWCAKLTEVARDLNAAKFDGPFGDWRAADVERVIYRALRNSRTRKQPNGDGIRPDE